MQLNGAKLSGGFAIQPNGDCDEMKLISTREQSKDANLGKRMETNAYNTEKLRAATQLQTMEIRIY